MPINRLLKDKHTPEEIELLNKAFNHALNLLGVIDRNDPLCDMVARKVIEAGTTRHQRAARDRGESRGADWPTVRPPPLAASSFRCHLLAQQTSDAAPSTSASGGG